MAYIDGINAGPMTQFLNALESGKYKQGHHRLHTAADDTMCCLGVATAELGPQCGVTLLDKLEDEYHLSPLSRLYEDSEGVRYYLLMPPAVTELLGIPANYIEHSGSGDVILVLLEADDDIDEPYERDEEYLVAVSTLNDQGVPFETIARRIRETLSVKEG
jgi:hypothetical protein